LPFFWIRRIIINECISFLRIQKRIGNDYFTFQGSTDFLFTPNEILILDSLDFTLPNKIFITFKKNLEVSSGEVYFYSPSFEMRKGKYTRRIDGVEIDFNVSMNEQKKGAFIFKDKNNTFFGCFTKQSEKSDTLNYLLKKIKFKNKKNLGEKCLEVK
jgi:hypothetical protein